MRWRMASSLWLVELPWAVARGTCERNRRSAADTASSQNRVLLSQDLAVFTASNMSAESCLIQVRRSDANPNVLTSSAAGPTAGTPAPSHPFAAKGERQAGERKRGVATLNLGVRAEGFYAI